MIPSKHTILIIDDSSVDIEFYRRNLGRDKKYSYQIITAQEAKKGLELCHLHQPDLVLLDYQLPDLDGVEFLNKLRLDYNYMEIPVIMLTGRGDENIVVQAFKSGAQDYINKTKLTTAELLRAVHVWLEKSHLLRLLWNQKQQKLLLDGMLLRIRQFLRLEEILDTAVEEVREFLKADRVVVYKFDPEMNGHIAAESVIPPWSVSLHAEIQDTCFRENQGIAYLQGKIRAITDIDNAGLTSCHIELLKQFQVKANLVVPILLRYQNYHAPNYHYPNKKAEEEAMSNPSSRVLWGLLVAHQCSSTREWKNNELDLLHQLSVQLAVAIQQAELYSNLQLLNAELEQKVEERTKELQANENKFRAIFNNTFQFTGLLTLEGILLEANHSALNFAGVSRADVVNHYFWDTHWWGLSQDIQNQLKEAIARARVGQFIHYEVDVKGADNRVATIDFSLRPLKNESGQIVMLIAEGRDITERKKAEATLYLQAQILNEIHDAVISTDINGIIQSWNQGAEKLYGYSAAEVIGQNVQMLYEAPQALQKLIVSPLIAKGSHEVEITTISKSGKIIYVNLRLSLLQDSEGQIIRLIGCAHNITERKQAEMALKQLNFELEHRIERRTAALRESEQRFATLAKAVPVGIFRWDLDGKCIYVNDYLLKITGKTEQQVLGRVWLEILYQEDQKRIARKWQKILSKREYFQDEIKCEQPDGLIVWLYCQALPENDPNGNHIGYIGTFTDITERKQDDAKLQETNKQLAASNAELARVTRLKDEFLANMSHELRTPLNAILGISEALHAQILGPINNKQTQGLHIIEQSGKHLLELINDILDLSKIEAGQIELEYTHAHLPQLCQSTLTFVKQQAYQKRIQLDLKIQPNLPTVLVDERRIRQVLINLLNNAIKFTPEGGLIILKVTLEQFPPQTEFITVRDFIRVSVIDTGIGIASHNLHKLFQPFVQVDSALNRQYNGTGLGLALVKRIVELHGGIVDVTSEVGVGSCFSFDLPCDLFSVPYPKSINQTSQPQELLSQESPNQSPLILLAEDNEANIFSITNYLEAKGYRIILAKNGEEAIELTHSHLPDLILMDIQMPIIDGLQAIKKIRDFSCNLKRDIPIIALTALAMPEDQEKCLKAGANEYLPKPVKLKELASVIQKFLKT